MTTRTRKRRPGGMEGRGGRRVDPFRDPLPASVTDIVLDRIDLAHRRGLCRVPPAALAVFLRAVFPEVYPVDGRPVRTEPQPEPQPIEGP